ncbi:MAG TPA: hypothetical protein PKC76_19525 [Saprospiraceae bacterium]|nr:hypothetical protein [Saprospiraceae bacterium]
MMKATTAKALTATNAFYFLVFAIVAIILMYVLNITTTFSIQGTGTNEVWESLDVAIENFLMRSETPPGDLSNEEIEEITIFYNDGIEFSNDPDEPCQKLKLLGLKKIDKWIHQFRNRVFTVDKIKEIMQIGSRYVYSHPSGSNFTRIVHPDGTSIIVDFVNCIIWQVAPAHFKF